MKYALGDKQVQLIGDGHFIAPGAAVIGDVILHEEVSIWFCTVLRGDVDQIEIGPGSNIQDGTVVHADPGSPVRIGRNVTVGHNAMIHGCEIGDGSLIGINAVVLNGAKIGKGCLIGANALVTEGSVIPDGSMVLGSPGKVVRQLDEAAREQLLLGAEGYRGKARRYNSEFREQP
ncbi:gamma carbonic anhydrase family protein [Haliea sp. E17]|uniref:gamma carbonic anhydrase family protein n=1 Tax=Haliea sp. E17 TaxID=3401576 RepID=UPI003AADEDF5